MLKKKPHTGQSIHKKLDRFLEVIMQEIADVRLELKQDIQGLRTELKQDIQSLRIDMSSVKADIKTMKGDVRTLRMEVHQNQLVFMGYMDRTDKRLDKLEAKAS